MDCSDLSSAVGFWREALGYDDPNPLNPEAQFHGIVSPDGGLHHLTFQRVTEPKVAKNRVHLDLFVDDVNEQAKRLIGLGAKALNAHEEDGFNVMVMEDPEGNEFCLVGRVS